MKIFPTTNTGAHFAHFTARNSAENKKAQKSENPVSRSGEAANLTLATFIGGLSLGGRLMWELFDGEFLIDTAQEVAQDVVEKNKGEASEMKQVLCTLGATAGIVAALISGFALLYTFYKAPKIKYDSKINAFEKGKEMDVYISSNNVEKELYAQLSEQAKEADEIEKEKLKEQYMKLKMAKNQVPEFIEITKRRV